MLHDTIRGIIHTIICTHFIYLDIEEGVLPRAKNVPRRFQNSNSASHQYTCYKDKARQEYYQVLDMTISTIKARFEQQGMRVLINIEKIVINTLIGIDTSAEMDFITTHYNDVIDISCLKDELNAVSCLNLEEIADLGEFVAWFKQMDRHTLYPQLAQLLRLVIVLPASNASSERCFSAMRRLKTFQRSSMMQQRLNHLMYCIFTKTLPAV